MGRSLFPYEYHIDGTLGWDTAGAEYFLSITRSYDRGVAGALIVYDATSRASFLQAEEWPKDVRAHAGPNFTAVLVANNIELVPEEEESASATRRGGRLRKRPRRKPPQPRRQPTYAGKRR